MGYGVALSKAWAGLQEYAQEKNFSVSFLADEYSVDVEARQILSLSCNVPAKDYLSILILHYLSKKIEGLPSLEGEWISFKQLAGGQAYYPAFKKRVIDTIERKYGQKPEAIFALIEHFKAKKAQLADASIAIEAFDKVPVLITLTKADEEFTPEANVLFDKSIVNIFCTEDIVILSEILAYHI